MNYIKKYNILLDYLVNAGGLIAVVDEYEHGDSEPVKTLLNDTKYKVKAWYSPSKY